MVSPSTTPTTSLDKLLRLHSASKEQGRALADWDYCKVAGIPQLPLEHCARVAPEVAVPGLVELVELHPGLAGSICRSKAVVLTAFCFSPVRLARLSVIVSAMRISMVCHSSGAAGEAVLIPC